MIPYDPGHWGVACIFKLRGSVFPKAMVWAVPCTILAGCLHHFIKSNEKVKGNLGMGGPETSIYGGFTFILGFLLVYRFQQGYNRWWDAATLLMQVRGEWFNSYSCLIAFCNPSQEKQDDVYKFQQQLVRLFSLLHGCALVQVSQMQTHSFELINLDGLDAQSLQFLQDTPDKCEITLQWIQRLIVQSESSQVLKIAPPILSRVYNQLGNGIVNLSNARKIKEYPIPFPLAQMVMVMLMCHALFTPVICAATVESTSWSALLAFIVTFSYWSILYMALELEMPFGDDPNDLPICDMAQSMNTSLCQMLEPLAMQVPAFDIQGLQSGLSAQIVDLDSDLSKSALSSGWENPIMYQIAVPKPVASVQTIAPHLVPAVGVQKDLRGDSLVSAHIAGVDRSAGGAGGPPVMGHQRSTQQYWAEVSGLAGDEAPNGSWASPGNAQGRPPDDTMRSDSPSAPLSQSTPLEIQRPVPEAKMSLSGNPSSASDRVGDLRGGTPPDSIGSTAPPNSRNAW